MQRVGNSRGIIIPKPILAQLGFERDVDIEVEGDALVIRKPELHVRSGWAEASRKLAAGRDDALVWPELANDGDDDLTW